MTVQSYYVEKSSDTSADILCAVGFASLLSEVLQQCGRSGKGLIIRDCGSYYEIQPPTAITLQDIAQCQPFVLVKPVVTEKQAKKYEAQELSLDGFDYQGQMEIRKSYFQKLKDLPAKYRTPGARFDKQLSQVLDTLEEPASELVYYQAIIQMKIASSFNELAMRWLALGSLQREHICLLLDVFKTPENDVAATIQAWQKLAHDQHVPGKALTTQLQIVNPTTGKGVNRPKASTVPEGNPDNFWLLELLKFVGFMTIAAPYVVQGSKDRKAYILLPQVIELSTLEGMVRKFRAVCWSSTVVKLDILAALRFAQVFLERRKEALIGEAEDDFLEEEQLYSIAHGFEVISYKDMGSAFATMNVATINLPQWIPAITTLQQVKEALSLLDEHLTIIQHIRNGKDQEGAEEYELLRLYRHFLSGYDLKPFWHFTAAYSHYLMSQREHEKDPRRHLRAFTTDGLERLLAMSSTREQKKLSPITSNPGFKRIAYAIRQATVRAQYRRSQQRDRTYEVRYGLGQDLEREARYPDKFLAALSRFLQQYNAETAREEEKLANKLGRALTSIERREHKLRGSVAYTDIDEIIKLIDDFGSETVCLLLIAYGYASEPRKEVQEPTGNTGELEPPSEMLPADMATDEE